MKTFAVVDRPSLHGTRVTVHPTHNTKTEAIRAAALSPSPTDRLVIRVPTPVRASEKISLRDLNPFTIVWAQAPGLERAT